MEKNTKIKIQHQELIDATNVLKEEIKEFLLLFIKDCESKYFVDKGISNVIFNKDFNKINVVNYNSNNFLSNVVLYKITITTKKDEYSIIFPKKDSSSVLVGVKERKLIAHYKVTEEKVTVDKLYKIYDIINELSDCKKHVLSSEKFTLFVS